MRCGEADRQEHVTGENIELNYHWACEFLIRGINFQFLKIVSSAPADVLPKRHQGVRESQRTYN